MCNRMLILQTRTVSAHRHTRRENGEKLSVHDSAGGNNPMAQITIHTS